MTSRELRLFFRSLELSVSSFLNDSHFVDSQVCYVKFTKKKIKGFVLIACPEYRLFFKAQNLKLATLFCFVCFVISANC